MKKSIAFVLLISVILSTFPSCKREIPYPDEPPEYSRPDVTTTNALEAAIPEYIENVIQPYEIEKGDFSVVLEAEDFFKGDTRQLVDGYSGEGHVVLSEGEEIIFTAEIPKTQHYMFELRFAAEDAAVSIFTEGSVEQATFYSNQNDQFRVSSANGIFMRGGSKNISVRAIRGTVNIDTLIITNGEAVTETAFEISPQLSNINANEKAKSLYSYLCDSYGEKIISGQFCTAGTMTEINAIYEATGRYPIIRASDIGIYSRCYPSGGNRFDDELKMIQEYNGYGGVTYLSWTWYSPEEESSHYLSKHTEFDINAAFTTAEIPEMDITQLKALAEAGKVTEELIELVLDIDDMAEKLKLLKEQDITVIFRPLMQAGLGWFWWDNGTPESYIWLWQLLFTRLQSYHELNNLIWVWDAVDKIYYPGNKYVDIVGVTNYNLTDSTNTAKFNTALLYTQNKPIAYSETGLVPNANELYRDNAMWLWFALYSGDYLIGDDGLHASAYNTKDRLNYIYNHELVLTLDEFKLFRQ